FGQTAPCEHRAVFLAFDDLPLGVRGEATTQVPQYHVSHRRILSIRVELGARAVSTHTALRILHPHTDVAVAEHVDAERVGSSLHGLDVRFDAAVEGHDFDDRKILRVAEQVPSDRA